MRKNKTVVNDTFKESLFFFSAKDRPQEEIIERPSLNDLYDKIEKIASTDATVLITGESGVGKEIIAKAIHKKACRPHHLFFLINASTITDSLFESIIYGHEKGAFTGAVNTHKGIFELADSGTVFLDEIGDVSPEMQIKLLSTIEARSFRKLGGSAIVKTNFQLICATNRDLRTAVATGTFRHDLYFRIKTIPIHVPPIRGCTNDIELLARNFLKIYSKKYSRPAILYEGELKKRMEKYHWPGNVRELESYIQRIVVMDDANMEIDAEDHESVSDKEKKDRQECFRLFEAIIKADWNLSKTASILGCSRRTVYNMMERHKISRPKTPSLYSGQVNTEMTQSTIV